MVYFNREAFQPLFANASGQLLFGFLQEYAPPAIIIEQANTEKGHLLSSLTSKDQQI